MWYLIVSIPDLCTLTYFNNVIYHEGNISRLPDFDVCSLLDIRKRKYGLMENVKIGI